MKKLKAAFITVIFILISMPLFSQSNFYKIGIGAGAGITQSFTDVQKHAYGLAGYGTADFFFTPFISIGMEGQVGKIKGGDKITDPNHREFTNAYKAISFNGKLYLGEVINYDYSPVANALKGLYVGSGLGVIQNKMTDIVRKQPNKNSLFPGANQSRDILVPLNLGINFYFPDHLGDYRYVLNFNFQSNITLGEGLDGYNDSSINFRSGSPDIYNYISVGFRYNFGPVGLSNKTFRRL